MNYKEYMDKEGDDLMQKWADMICSFTEFSEKKYKEVIENERNINVKKDRC